MVSLDDDFLPLFRIEFPEEHQKGGHELFVIEFTKNKFNNLTSSVTIKIFDYSKTEISEVSIVHDKFRVIHFRRSYSFTTMEILVKLCKVYQYLSSQTHADQFKMEIVNDTSGDVSFTTNDAFIRRFGNDMENLYVAYYLANGKSTVQNINEFDDIRAEVTLGDYKNFKPIKKLQEQNPIFSNSSELLEDAFYLLKLMKDEDGRRLSEVTKQLTELNNEKNGMKGQSNEAKQARRDLQSRIEAQNMISRRLSTKWSQIKNQQFYAAMYKRIQEFKVMNSTQFTNDVAYEVDVYKKILAKTKTQHKQYLEQVLVDTNSIYFLIIKVDAADPQAVAAALAEKEPTEEAAQPTEEAAQPTASKQPTAAATETATADAINIYNNYLLRLMPDGKKIDKLVGPIMKIIDRNTPSKLKDVIEYLKSDEFDMSWYELFPSLLNEIINLTDNKERLAKLKDYVRFLKLKHTYPSDITIGDFIGTVRITRNIISSKLRTIIYFDEYFRKYKKETLGLQRTPEAEQILIDLHRFLETLDTQHFNAAERDSQFHKHINHLMRFTDPSFATKKIKTDGTSFNTVVTRQLAAAKASDYDDRNVNKALFDAIQSRDDALNSRHYVLFNSNPEYPTMEHKRFFWTHILPDLRTICLSNPSPGPSPRHSASAPIQDDDKQQRMRKLILPFFQFVVLNSKHKNLDIFKDYVTVVEAQKNMRLELRFLISKQSGDVDSPSSPTRKRSRRSSRLTRFPSRRIRKEEE